MLYRGGGGTKLHVIERQSSELLGEAATVLPLGEEDKSDDEAEGEERSEG